MAGSYDAATYLLDKENIRDTVIRMVSCQWVLFVQAVGVADVPSRNRCSPLTTPPLKH